MLTSRIMSGLRAAQTSVVITRNLAAAQKSTDPIQQLFLDKIREYKSKSAAARKKWKKATKKKNGKQGKKSGGKLVEASPEIEKEMKNELEKLEKQYGGGSGVDMTAFPTFKFEEPKLDPIDEPKATEKKK